MVIDTSAVIAILQDEPERPQLMDRIVEASTRLISAASAVETSMIVLSRRGQSGLDILRDFLARTQIETVPFSPDHVELAVDAFRRYGKGRHRAGLNLGDCFSYALAKATGEPLLFKDGHFVHTDVRSAS